MKNQQLVIFYDWDGTLCDSLSNHIKFLRDMNKRFKWGLDLPDPKDKEASKRIVGSPMIEFLRNAGIPEDVLPEVVQIYATEFTKGSRYQSELFPGSSDMVKRFSEEGIIQGILTSNYQQGINKVLRKNGIYNLLFPMGDKVELDRFHDGRKSRFLEHHKIINSLLQEEMYYVADTKADYEESKEAGVSFIGVSDGWGFSPGEKTDFSLVDNRKQLEETVMQLVQS